MLNKPEVKIINIKEAENAYFLGQSYVLIRPGGNDTCLVNGIIQNDKRRKDINDFIMNLYPNVEQVGFIDLSKEVPELMMAGGEFCGNATRSTAWLALKGKPGELDIKVSGVDKLLKAGISEDGEAYAQMPIYKEPTRLRQDGSADAWIVEMQGITQYVDFEVTKIEGLSTNEIKQKALEAIKLKGLDKYPAAGIIYSIQKNGKWQIVPVVYVRDIDTLFLETACGSGTTALGQVLALKRGGSIKDIEVLQPSGLPIKISVNYGNGVFTYAQIKGPIEKLKSGSLESTYRFDYIVEVINNQKELNEALTSESLYKLYREIFSQPPYEELFTTNDVQDIFEEYLKYGQILLAKNKDGVIGFEAILPLVRLPDARWVTAGWNIDIDKGWYLADLGVKDGFRRNGLGQRMVEEQLELLPKGVDVLVRTSEDNLPARTLYERMGFKQLIGVIQTVESVRIDGKVKGDRRVFYKTKT